MCDRYGLLFARYEPPFYNWELTEMQRKLWLTSLVAFIEPGTVTQVMFALAIATVFTVIHIKFQVRRPPVLLFCLLFFWSFFCVLLFFC